jgi:hypothetical protein
VHANMLNRRCLPKYVGTLQVREGDVELPSSFGLICCKKLTLYVWADAATELAHLPLLYAQLFGVRKLCFALRLFILRFLVCSADCTHSNPPQTSMRRR